MAMRIDVQVLRRSLSTFYRASRSYAHKSTVGRQLLQRWPSKASSRAPIASQSQVAG